MARVAVLGSTGMAGSMVSHYLSQQGYNVTKFSRKPITGYTDKLLNVHNQEQLDNFREWINIYQPAAIINCIGCLVEDSANNPAEAIFLNSYLPHLLENMTKENDIKVIHISTDCVFNGNDPSYTEKSLPNETNWYGRSKALGELKNNKDLTFRQSIIGPAPRESNTGLLNWALTQPDPVIKGFVHVLWNGVTTLELAKNIHRVLKIHPELSGIYHLVPQTDVINKFDLLGLIMEQWKTSTNITLDLKHESSKVLVNTRKDFPVHIPNYEEQIKELHTYMQTHDIKVAHLK